MAVFSVSSPACNGMVASFQHTVPMFRTATGLRSWITLRSRTPLIAPTISRKTRRLQSTLNGPRTLLEGHFKASWMATLTLWVKLTAFEDVCWSPWRCVWHCSNHAIVAAQQFDIWGVAGEDAADRSRDGERDWRTEQTVRSEESSHLTGYRGKEAEAAEFLNSSTADHVPCNLFLNYNRFTIGARKYFVDTPDVYKVNKQVLLQKIIYSLPLP